MLQTAHVASPCKVSPRRFASSTRDTAEAALRWAICRTNPAAAAVPSSCRALISVLIASSSKAGGREINHVSCNLGSSVDTCAPVCQSLHNLLPYISGCAACWVLTDLSQAFSSARLKRQLYLDMISSELLSVYIERQARCLEEGQCCPDVVDINMGKVVDACPAHANLLNIVKSRQEANPL